MQSSQLSQNDNNIIIQLPDIKVDSGSILFFRPSGNSLDKSYPLVMNNEK